MMFPLLIILANLSVLLASEVEKIICPDGSSCPIGQTCQQTATTGTFHCTSLPSETQTGQELVPALAFPFATSALRPASSTNTSSVSVQMSSGAQKSSQSWGCPGTQCAGSCCPTERAVCCGTSETCCSEGSSCCSNHCCLRGSSCCRAGCCQYASSCCGDGCCEYGSSCCGDGCCERGSSCCSNHCCLRGSSCCGDICCPMGSNCCTDSFGSGWCCEDGHSCYLLNGYCLRRNTATASLPSASVLLAVLLMSAFLLYKNLSAV